MARSFFGNDFFDQMLQTSGNTASSGPSVDVYSSQNEVIVAINLPGMENIHTLEIKIEGETLTIKGSIDSPYQAYEATLMERKRGVFEREIPLPAKVKETYDSARYKKGVLELRYRKLS